MADNRTIELLLDMLYAFLIDYQNILKAAISEEISEKETIARQRAIAREHAERIEQAIAATLGSQIDADLRKAIDFMRIWIAEDAHLGESAISRELEKAEGLRKLDAIENAIAATLGNGTCEDLGGTGGYTCSQFACSECGCTIDITDYQYNEPTMYTADGIADVPHFCPGCGKAVKR